MKSLHPAPSGVPVRVGARLRASRQAQNLTIEQVATATNLSRGFLSRVERDATSPSVATLVTLCEVLSLPIGSLFEDVDTEIIHLHDAPRINLGGRGLVERMLTPRSQSRMQVLRSSLDPGADGGTELYTINCDVETIHIITGELCIMFSTRTETLSAGDTLTFPGRWPHTWQNRGHEVADVIWIIVPAAWSGSS
ncbi:MAG: XRE family transcriptional regulator [Terrimesophilobacter sp.]